MRIFRSFVDSLARLGRSADTAAGSSGRLSSALARHQQSWLRPVSEMGSPGKRLPLCPAAAEKRRCAERAKLARYLVDKAGRFVGRRIPGRFRADGTWAPPVPGIPHHRATWRTP